MFIELFGGDVGGVGIVVIFVSNCDTKFFKKIAMETNRVYIFINIFPLGTNLNRLGVATMVPVFCLYPFGGFNII